MPADFALDPLLSRRPLRERRRIAVSGKQTPVGRGFRFTARRSLMSAFLTDLFSNFYVSLAGKLLLVAVMIPLIGMVIGFAEMKLSAKMQARVGPYFAGGRW
ncbi:MAG TPA: hypothetical protein VIH32_03670, partial [Acidimicrobiia bacterium]